VVDGVGMVEAAVEVVVLEVSVVGALVVVERLEASKHGRGESHER